MWQGHLQSECRRPYDLLKDAGARNRRVALYVNCLPRPQPAAPRQPAPLGEILLIGGPYWKLRDTAVSDLVGPDYTRGPHPDK